MALAALETAPEIAKAAATLRGASETLLIPLACRAKASKHGLVDGFVDRKAEEICAALDVDFDRYAADVATMRGAVRRGMWFDRRVLRFLAAHPTGLVLSLGSGLNTMYERVRAATPADAWRWIDSDLPDVVALRGALFEDDRARTTVALDLSHPQWADRLGPLDDRPLLIISEAVLIYLPDALVRAAFSAAARLGERRGACVFLYDWCSPAFMRRSRRHPAMKKLKDDTVVFRSSMRRPQEVRQYDDRWRVVAQSGTPMTGAGLAPAIFYALYRIATFGRRPYGLAEAALISTQHERTRP
ncbi:MAG: class I SAM-dependent methyltransferase [Pseudomonadota bacterium]